MDTLVLFGEKDDYKLLDFIVQVFENNITFHYQKDSVFYKTGNGHMDITVIDTDDLKNIKIKDSIIIFKEKVAMQSFEGFSTSNVCILNSENVNAVLLASLLQCKTVTLGLRSTDTLSISSTLEDSSVISLMRVIDDIYGGKVEPFDVVIEKTKTISDYYLLIGVFLMLYFDFAFSLQEKIKI